MLNQEECEELGRLQNEVTEHVSSQEDADFVQRLVDLSRRDEAAKSEKAIDALAKVAAKWERIARANMGMVNQ